MTFYTLIFRKRTDNPYLDTCLHFLFPAPISRFIFLKPRSTEPRHLGVESFLLAFLYDLLISKALDPRR